MANDSADVTYVFREVIPCLRAGDRKSSPTSLPVGTKFGSHKRAELFTKLLAYIVVLRWRGVLKICYFNHILISYSILDCYLQKNMPAKYRNTRRLSASDHIRQVVGDCSQSLYALRVHRHYGLTDVCLHTVFRSVVVAKLLYACTAWSGFVTASDRHRVDAFLRRSKRCGYCHLDLQQTSGGE